MRRNNFGFSRLEVINEHYCTVFREGVDYIFIEFGLPQWSERQAQLQNRRGVDGGPVGSGL